MILQVRKYQIKDMNQSRQRHTLRRWSGRPLQRVPNNDEVNKHIAFSSSRPANWTGKPVHPTMVWKDDYKCISFQIMDVLVIYYTMLNFMGVVKIPFIQTTGQGFETLISWVRLSLPTFTTSSGGAPKHVSVKWGESRIVKSLQVWLYNHSPTGGK